MLFVIYLYYTYKVSKDVSDAGVFKGQMSLLHKIAAAMGAMIGLHYFLFLFQAEFGVGSRELVVGTVLMQQCLVMALLMCTKKVRGLYRKCLSTETKQ